MRRASVLALSGLCLALPRAATAAEPPPLPAEAEPSLPPADAASPTGDAPPTLPDGGAGAPTETAPPTDPGAPTEPAPTPAVEGAANAELTTTGADVTATGATDELKRNEPGMVRGRREPVINSLRGGVGLYNTSLADVGARHSVRFRLHTDFFRKTGFIYNSSDPDLGSDEHARVRGTINLGYSPFKWGEMFVAIHSQANRNTRKQPGRQDPPQQFALGDLDFGIKGAHRMVKGGAIGVGGQVGVGLLSGPGRLRADKVNFNIDALFTLDVRYLTKKQVPFRFTTNIGWILDNSAKLYDFAAISDATSREVSRFALGINPSRVRMRYGFDFPIRLGKQKQFGLDPIAELSWDVATQQMSAFKQEGATPSPLPKSSMWATIGLRANVVSGLHLDIAADIGMVSPNFEYGPPVAPWSLILGLGWAIDPNPVIKEVPAPVTELPPPPAVIDGRIVGQVVDPSGAPVAGALVRFPGSAGNAIVTDEAGNFTSFRFPEGAVTVVVELQNKATKEATAEVKAGEDTPLTIQMDVANTPPAGFVDGAFTDESGAGIAITLAVTGMGIDEPFQSNESGLIRLELPAGEYGAIARAEGFEDKTLRFTVAAGDQAVVVKETLVRSVPPKTPNVVGKGKSLRLKKSIKYDGNNPSEKTLPLLDELAAYLRVHPEYETIEIGVHSDDRGNPKQKTTERADNVRNYLLSKGVSPDRVIAVGHGASRPVAVNMTASGRAKNNRTVLRVTKYTKPAAPAAAPAAPTPAAEK